VQLLTLAATQFGMFTRQQAHDAELTDGMLRRRVRAGQFEQVARHVYRVAGTPVSWEQRVLLACLAGGPECVASHRTAAALLAFDGFEPGIIEVTVPRNRRYRSRDFIVHQSTDLAAIDRIQVGAIPVTTPERTLIDLGAVTCLGRVEEAFDGAERDSTARRDHVRERHAAIRRQGRNGVGPMAAILDERLVTVPHSVLERRFVRLLQDADLPMPTLQHRVVLLNGRVAFLDAAYVACKLGFELDGHGTHATRTQRAADNARANALGDLGWTLRRFTYEQVVNDGPTVVRAVRNALNLGFGVTR
jgi:very-short-patch-repair endonuclease